MSPYQSLRFVLMACYEDARRTKARPAYYKYTVTGNSEIRFGDTKVGSSKEKNQAKPIQSNPPIKHLMLQQSLGVSAHIAAKKVILMPSAVLELLSSSTTRTDPISVLRPIVGWKKLLETGNGFPTSKNWKHWWVRLDGRLVRPPQRSNQSNRLRTGKAKVRT